MTKFKSWDELSELEQLQTIFSDASKDAYGFRDRSPTTEQWNSVEWLKERIDHFSAVINENNQKEQIDQKYSIENFERHVLTVMTIGSAEREVALNWIAQGVNYNGDWDYVCYHYGLPYGYFEGKF